MSLHRMLILGLEIWQNVGDQHKLPQLPENNYLIISQVKIEKFL